MALIKLTSDNFGDIALGSDKPVLIDFYATWCGPCKMLSPIIEEIASERNDIIVAKVDVDDEPSIADAYSVQSIPTLILLKNGKLAAHSVGFVSKQTVIDMLKLPK